MLLRPWHCNSIFPYACAFSSNSSAIGRDEECTLEGLRDNDSDAHYDRDMSQEQCHSQWPVQSASDNHLDAKYNRSMSKTQFRPPSPVYSANDNHLDSQNGRGVSKLQFCPQSPVDSARSSQSFGMAWDEQENAAISNTCKDQPTSVLCRSKAC